MQISCCLIGFGRIGQIHYKNIIDGHNRNYWNLLYIIESEKEVQRVNEILQDKKITVTTSLDKVLNDPKINCIFICSPTHMHYSHIMKCLQHGKHVFCEKPIDENIENIKKCYDFAKSKHLHLLCAYNRRFDNKISMLKTNIHSIGDINQIISVTRDYPYPNVNFLKASSGLFNDCALHDIDYINWILDDKPVTVYASAKSSKPSEISGDQLDDSCIIMEYSNKIRAFIYCSRISKTYDQRIEIFGDKGNLTVENPYGNINLFTQYGRNISFDRRYEQSYINELSYFYNVLTNKEPMLITKEECINNLIIIKACEESYRTEKKVLINYGYKLRDYTNADQAVKNNYLKARKYQTIDHVKNMHEKYLKFDTCLTIDEIFEKLEDFVDISDPDVSLPNLVHLYQSAEMSRKDNQPEWFQFITLLHDIGKIMYLKGDDKDGTSLKEQWGMVGDTFLVGCKIPDSIIFPEYNSENPDMKNPLYNTYYGIYKEKCGLENTWCSWGHDEYLYQILVHNNIEVPLEALYIIRYHSLYVYHDKDEYQHLMNETDHKYKPFLKLFNKYDLYSKPDCKVIIQEDIKNYYKNLIKKFIPNGRLSI